MMVKPLKTNILIVLGAIVGVLHSVESLADTVVYKETCGYDAFESWNYTCAVELDTSDRVESAPTKAITFCASFSNRGGLNLPAIIVHNGKDGDQSKPTDMFDTVKFQGGLVANKVVWFGSGSRRAPGLSMRGEFMLLGEHENSKAVYTETVWDGRRQIGEIRSLCTRMLDQDEKSDGAKAK